MSNLRDEFRNNLITSVISMFPDDPAAQAARERLRQRDPEAASGIRPYVEKSSMIEAITEIHDVSPIPVQELLRQDPAELVTFLLNFSEKSWGRPNREGLINAVSAAFLQDLGWGFRLLEAMAKDGKDNDIWIALLWKIKWENLSAAQKAWTITSFDPAHEHTTDFLRPFVRLVFGQAFSDPLIRDDPRLLNKVIGLSLTMWALVENEPPLVPDSISEHDWIFDAINSVAGQVCEFWLQLTVHEQSKAPENERAWPEIIVAKMNSILTGRNKAHQMGLAILSQSLGNVRYLAPVWTVQHLYPCFELETKGPWAFICWNSFAGYGRLSRELASELPPYFLKMFKHLPEMKGALAERFVVLVAAISVSQLWNVNESGWLDAFHKDLVPKLRRKWLSGLASLVKGSLPPDKTKLWNEWLREWWKLRIQALPTPIHNVETEGFYRLALALGPVAHETVPFLEKCPPVEIQWGNVFLDTQHTTLFADDPAGLVAIVRWILPYIRHLSSRPEDVDEFINKLPRWSRLRPDLEEICEQLVRLQVTTAGQIRDRIRREFIET